MLRCWIQCQMKVDFRRKTVTGQQDECLNTHWFLSLVDDQDKLDNWRREYNYEGRIRH